MKRSGLQSLRSGALAIAALALGCSSDGREQVETGTSGTWEHVFQTLREEWVLNDGGEGESTVTSGEVGGVVTTTWSIASTELSTKELTAELTCISSSVQKDDGSVEDLTCQGRSPRAYSCELVDDDELACTCTSCQMAAVLEFDRVD